VRIIVWVGLGILALNVLFIAALASVALISRFRIARTRRELERLGLVVRLPYVIETRPIWPRGLAVLGGLAAVIVTTSLITTPPSAGTRASSAGPSLLGAPTGAAVRPIADPRSAHPATQEPTPSQSVAGPLASVAPPPSPVADVGTDAGAPVAVAAVATSPTAIRLEWAPVADAVRYDIERSPDTAAWEAVATTTGEQTAYTDVALSPGTTYYYRVAAFVGQEVSRSDAVSATTTVDTSTAPVLVSATASATSIELTWIDLDGELGYRIERSQDGTTGWTGIGTTGQDVTSYTDTGLASATSYSYRVVAVMADGESPPSTVLSSTTDPGPSTSDADAAVTSDAPTDPKDLDP
jgi:hypothetical protein